jgi:ubiquinone/menaquinone biosynthesis C-methylase UbiE
MRPSAQFWDRIADRYARKPVPNEAVYQKKLRLTREHLRGDMAVLEFGCGTGTTAVAHAPHVRQILGIDSSARMIELARTRAQASSAHNACFQQASIQDYAAADGSFDAVLGLSVLHLLPDWPAAIAKVHRILRPGGIFVSSTPCLGANHAWLKWIAPLGARLGLMPALSFFSAEELLRTMQCTGFGLAHEWRPPDGRTLFAIARKTSA